MKFSRNAYSTALALIIALLIFVTDRLTKVMIQHGLNSFDDVLWSRFALGLVLGGALGNFLDRVTHGSVTDFIEVFHGSWTFPAFNVADSAISVGGAMLVLEMLWPRSRPQAPLT